MSKFSWRNGFTVGIAFGLFAGILLVLVLALNWSIDPTASSNPSCGGSTNNCADDSEGLPQGWYWLRRFFAMEDTLAQWIMMFFTVAAAGLLLLTLKATQKMAADTRDIGEAQIRAYVEIDNVGLTFDPVDGCDISPDVSSGETDICPKVRFLIRNNGVSPARNIRATFSWNYGALFAKDGALQIVERQSSKRFPYDLDDKFGYTIASSGERTFLIESGFTLTAMESISLARQKGGEGLVVGCVIAICYEDVFGNTIKEDFGFKARMNQGDKFVNMLRVSSVAYFTQKQIQEGQAG